MKIKKILQLLEVVQNKIPFDMYDSFPYTTKESETIDIKEMDFIHFVRAFKKIYEYDEGLQHSVSQTNQILKLEQEVSHLREKLVSEERASIMRIKDLKERNAYLQERIEELIPIKAYPKYDFCEIPNDSDGQEFLDNVKRYLNTNKYKMRVRGQHIKEELKGKGLTSYGQSIDESTHLRVYIEEK